MKKEEFIRLYLLEYFATNWVRSRYNNNSDDFIADNIDDIDRLYDAFNHCLTTGKIACSGFITGRSEHYTVIGNDGLDLIIKKNKRSRTRYRKPFCVFKEEVLKFNEHAVIR